MKVENFRDALVTLGIEEYEDRIFNSNSHGELFHLQQYFELARIVGATEWFAGWFRGMVEFAESEWERPESVFQHILEMLVDQVNKMNEE